MEEFRKHGLYTIVPIEEAVTITGKKPRGSRLVDINKGAEEKPEYGSRLVAKDIKKDISNELSVATPPLEAKKLRLSLVRTEGI